ncbi:MAG: sialidase family protein [Rhodanobacteraceae bacterium]
MKLSRALSALVIAGLMVATAGCGGSSNSSSSTPPPSPPPAPPPPVPPPPTPPLEPQYLASATSPFGANCDGATPVGTLYVNAEVEPSLAVDPSNGSLLNAVWQQDRWSTGGSRGIVAARSTDGGRSWTRQPMLFTRCAGGTGANDGNYPRASNPWITVSSDGTLNQLALAFSGDVLRPGSTSAVVAARSTDGGATWGPTQTLILDGSNFFNDKGAITADPVTVQNVYAVWDRLSSANVGPSEFTRSTDQGASWESARAIYDPGVNNQTISNAIVVLPNGTLVDMFLELLGTANGGYSSTIRVIRSSDTGDTWSAPITVAEDLAVGTRDPDTGNPIRDSALIPDIAVAPDGTLYVVWQDSRFSNGARDAIAISESVDAGVTWSSPILVNGDPTVAAFTPVAHVRDDGVIGVTYYDFRDNTTDTATLYTDHWLAVSMDASAWSDHQVAGPFDLTIAPIATSPGNGYFLGDYQALQSAGSLFLPMFVQTNSGNTTNRTDVFAAPAVSVTETAIFAAAKRSAMQAQPVTPDPAWRQRISDNIVRELHARLHASPNS